MATNHEAGGSNPSNCKTSSRGLPILHFDRSKLRLRPLLFAAVLTALDGLWAYQALAAVPRNQADTVGLSGLMVWVVFHLPAAAAASALAPTRPGLMGALGLLETFLIAWGLFAWLTREKK